MRVSEVYYSVQGEGPRTGLPTQFVRFGGCNLRCPGWPCDTQHAIDPKYREEWLVRTPKSLLTMIKKWPQMVTLTGGEPFLQNKAELDELIMFLVEHDFRVEAFTNGFLPWGKVARENVDFIMDFKLVGSGEDHALRETLPRVSNIRAMKPTDQIKFVVKDEHDLEQARSVSDYISRNLNDHVGFSVGRVWDSKEITDARLVDWIAENRLDWQLNVQIHKFVWEPNQRGV